jgi:hypothetical protein
MSPHYSSDEEEYEPDEPPALELNLDKLMARATRILGAKCTGADKRTRGANHEILVLRFQDSPSAPESLARARFSCIARFARARDNNPAKTISETATIRHIRQHTTIPVPEIYHYDPDPDNEIGAPFQLMERLPGLPLCKIWDWLALEHRKLVLAQIASVIAQLASLKFNQIGSLTEDGSIGPLQSPIHPHPKGPFPSTLAYLSSYIDPDEVSSPTLQTLYREIQTELSRFLAPPETTPTPRHRPHTSNHPSPSSTPTSTPRTCSSPAPSSRT